MGRPRPPSGLASPLQTLLVALMCLGFALPASAARLAASSSAGAAAGEASASRHLRRLLQSDAFFSITSQCSQDLQVGASYAVNQATYSPGNCNATFRSGEFVYCTTQPQRLPAGASGQVLTLPNSLNPSAAFFGTYLTTYLPQDQAYPEPSQWNANFSTYSTTDGFACTQGEPGCYFWFYANKVLTISCNLAPPPPPPPDGGGGSSIGAIVGGVVGGIAALAAIIGGFLFYRKKKAAKQAAAGAQADYRIDGKGEEEDAAASADAASKDRGLGATPPPSGYGGGPLGAGMGAAAGAGSASAYSGEGEGVKMSGAASTGSGAGAPGTPGAAVMSYQSLTASGGSGVTAKYAALAKDDPILSYINSKLPELTASVVSHGSGGSYGSSMPRRTSAGVDARSWEVSFEEIEIIRPIGEGSFGRVYLSRWHHTQVAVKILIDKASIHQDPKDSSAMMLSPSLQSKLDEEASLLAAMRHPYIVQFYGVCHLPPCILTEFCSRGSLTDVLARGRRDPARAAELTWHRVLSLALDAALGMLYLHTRPNPIVHRDLKSPNLLVDESWHVKVTDFNLSRLLEDSLGSRSSSMAAMNPRWLAPEVMKGGHATKASDVFSFAVVMWELLTWELPWAQSGAWQLVQQLMGGAKLAVPERAALPTPDTPSEESYNAYITLMEACWSTEEFARPTFEDISTELRKLVEGA